MSCFWQDFLGCVDPSCLLSPNPMFCLPQWESDSGLDSPTVAFFSDPALTVSVSPSTGRIVHVAAYAATNGFTRGCAGHDFNNCTLHDWVNAVDQIPFGGACAVDYSGAWGSSSVRNSASPPAQGPIIASGYANVDFDPTGAMPIGAVPALVYDSVNLKINGISGPWTVIVGVSTDVGTGVFVYGNTFCF